MGKKSFPYSLGRRYLHNVFMYNPHSPDPLKLFPQHQAGAEEPQRQKGRENTGRTAEQGRNRGQLLPTSQVQTCLQRIASPIVSE